MDAVGSLGTGSEGKERDEADMQGHRCWLQLPTRAPGAYLEHPRGAQQQLAPGGDQDFRRGVKIDRTESTLVISRLARRHTQPYRRTGRQ